MLRFSHLSKHFGLQTVLDEVNAEIAAGELIVVTGPSGTGKTTLVSLLIGAEKPNAGSISIDTIVIEQLGTSELQRYRRKIGVVFQDFKLLEKKTVFENIAFPLEAYGSSDAETELKTTAVLKKVGLAAMSHKFPAQLSGGEKQRVAIARALVHSPKLLIADEPTGNLDPENTKQIAELLQRIHTEEEVTMFITTHDPIFLETIAPERIFHLAEGKLMEIT